MTVTNLKHLAIAIALLAGGTALVMIGFLTRQQILARPASAPESAPTTQHSTPANQIGQAGASVSHPHIPLTPPRRHQGRIGDVPDSVTGWLGP